ALPIYIGLTPQTAGQLGGFKVQGKDMTAARQLLADAQALEQAGAFALVLEAVPAPLAKILRQKISVPVIGIGAGPDCDGQVLVVHDMLGLFEKFTPKFVKQYCHLAPDITQGVQAYLQEIQTGDFPAEEHSFAVQEDFSALLADKEE
uniref:3-methyl-2-oxobutanoate hydroxymethyltransferase n=1 Tax=Candidatus Electrothrix sp. TaxID=2170559 RepID=UPI0040560B55